ncbi:hypothetical protein M0R45_005997 [Rubus argutus]|uniref:Uncharacterized protein n=1 Tax=Rubus argutus TaxID=59490 RepID=A0AAW1YP69_RUBAR
MAASHLQINSPPSPPKSTHLLWASFNHHHHLSSRREAHRPKIDPHQFQPPSPLLANFTAAASSVISRTSIVPKSSHHTFSSSAKDTHPPLVYLGELHHRRRFQAKPVLSSSPNRRAHSL